MIAILLLGLIAPFVFIYSGFVYLLALPFLTVLATARPYWIRLPKRTRRQVVRYTLWGGSLLLWGLFLFGNK
jgi:hypothetical protein